MAKKRLGGRGKAIVALFKGEENYETLMLTAWNDLFVHLAIKGKGNILKIRKDQVKKGDKPCSCGRDSLLSE